MFRFWNLRKVEGSWIDRNSVYELLICGRYECAQHSSVRKPVDTAYVIMAWTCFKVSSKDAVLCMVSSCDFALTLHSAHSIDHSFGLRCACSTGQSTCNTDLPLLEKALIMPTETVQMPLVYVGKRSIRMCIDTSCCATNPVYIVSHIAPHGLFFDASILLRVLTNRDNDKSCMGSNVSFFFLIC